MRVDLGDVILVGARYVRQLHVWPTAATCLHGWFTDAEFGGEIGDWLAAMPDHERVEATTQVEARLAERLGPEQRHALQRADRRGRP